MTKSQQLDSKKSGSLRSQYKYNIMTYTTNTKYVDIETGKIITWNKRTKYIYIIIKTTKHATTNWQQGKCHIQYTKQVKRNPQQRLELN